MMLTHGLKYKDTSIYQEITLGIEFMTTCVRRVTTVGAGRAPHQCVEARLSAGRPPT
jgi:hypothetical protein